MTGGCNTITPDAEVNSRTEGHPMASRTYKIIDGPDIHSIFESLRNSYGSQELKPVFFEVENLIAKFSVLINGLEHDNMSGNSFYLTGVIGQENFEGYYNTVTRKGFFKILN